MHLRSAIASLVLVACGPESGNAAGTTGGATATGPATSTGAAEDESDGATSSAGTMASSTGVGDGGSSDETSGGASGWGRPVPVWSFTEPNTALLTRMSYSVARLDLGSMLDTIAPGHWVVPLPRGPAVKVTELGGETASSDDAAFWWGSVIAYRQSLAGNGEPQPVLALDSPSDHQIYVIAVTGGAVFAANIGGEFHLFRAGTEGDAVDLGAFDGGRLAGDGDRVWIAPGAGESLRVVDLAVPEPAALAVGPPLPRSVTRMWATEEFLFAHDRVEVSARTKTDGEVAWSHAAASDPNATIRAEGELVVWVNGHYDGRRHRDELWASWGFSEPEQVLTVDDGTVHDLALAEDALYVLYTAFDRGQVIVRLDRPDAR